MVLVVDDDVAILDTLRSIFSAAGLHSKCYSSASQVLESPTLSDACLSTDVRSPQMKGGELLEEIARRQIDVPVIVVSGNADVSQAVKAMKAGAGDFLEKPIDEKRSLSSIKSALETHRNGAAQLAKSDFSKTQLTRLSNREKEVLALLVNGDSNKQVAQKLCISPRTVEAHRANILQKIGATNVTALVKITMASMFSSVVSVFFTPIDAAYYQIVTVF